MTCKMEKHELLNLIYEIEFICVDLNLYCDLHPDNEAAVQDYNCYAAQLRELRDKYECMYGPLMNFGSSPTGFPFDWVDSPWPWQAKCN